MTKDPAPLTPTPDLRAQLRARRESRVARRERYFNLMAAGYSCSQIAKMVRTSVATVRREIDRALAERRLDAPERFAQVQVARTREGAEARRGRDRAWRTEGRHDLFAGRCGARPLSRPGGREPSAASPIDRGPAPRPADPAQGADLRRPAGRRRVRHSRRSGSRHSGSHFTITSWQTLGAARAL